MKKGNTRKSIILRWVESQGSVSFTELQRYIVDSRFGPGTYDSEWVIYYGKRMRRWRGYYCTHIVRWGGYLRTGKDRLEQTDSGRYITVRGGEIATGRCQISL